MKIVRDDLGPDVPHGGIDLAELRALGIDPATVIDLSVNTNPLGSSPAVLAAARAAVVSRYPSSRADDLRTALARRHGVPVEWVAAGNGAAELIWLAAIAARRGGIVLGPTFGEYARAIAVAGGRAETVTAAPPEFTPPLDALIARLADRPGLVFVCNPNNPTGKTIGVGDAVRILEAAPASLVVVDEAYLPLASSDEPLVALLHRPNLLLIRSLTKDFAIPGLRLGYALGQAAPALRAVAPPWNVNAVAIAAGLAALDDPDWADRGRERARADMDRLSSGLRDLGYAPVSTSANFLIVEVGDAAAVRRDLLRAGILVRDCASFGLPGYLRIAAGPGIDRLLAALPRNYSCGST